MLQLNRNPSNISRELDKNKGNRGYRAKQANTLSVTRRAIEQVTVDLLKPIKLFVKTITVDNGKGFANHLSIGKLLNRVVYFADPYSSWQRGANENTNGLIRQYLPKGSEFTSVTDQYVREIEYALNNRPRKRLNYRTPNQVFYNIR